MKIYGILSAILALAFGCLSLPINAGYLYDDMHVAIGFIITLIAFIPTVATFTTLGLNVDEHGENEDQKERRRLVDRAHPGIFWPIYIIPFVCLFFWFFPFFHPFYAFFGSVCLISAYWALYVYPKAKAILKT